MTDNIPDEIMREARRIVSAIAIQKPNAYEAKAEIVALAFLARDTAARKKREASEKTRAANLRTLLERNEALERERDELKHDVSRYVEIASDEATRAEAAEAKLAEAMKALEPFAAVAEHDIGEDETDDDIFWPISNARYSMSGRLRVGHLRAARRALAGGQEDG